MLAQSFAVKDISQKGHPFSEIPLLLLLLSLSLSLSLLTIDAPDPLAQ
jgi:hypothetical protein